ncbi:M66 family metalloprotease [Colwellia ponticola]|nr:M66 family metalloprotease [Colwellia ponticola]
MLLKKTYLPRIKKPTLLPATFHLKATVFASIAASMLSSGVLTSGVASAAEQVTQSTSAPLLVFNNNDLPSDLEGTLEASVSFAQSQIMPSKHQLYGDVQPHLIAERAALLLVKPKRSDLNINQPLTVTAINNEGKKLGTLRLNPPSQLPTTAYAIDGAPEGDIDFTPVSGPSTVINSAQAISKLNDPNAVFLSSKLDDNNLVDIHTADGVWTRNIYLPNSTSMTNKVVRVNSTAGYSSQVFYSGRSVPLHDNQKLVFKQINGQWFLDGELENNKLIYANNTWSVKLPPSFMQPGVSMRFKHENLIGELSNVNVGAPSALLINTIDLGMLTAPRGAFQFANDAAAQREYFQTLPVSRMTVSQYEAVFLEEVMLPNGTLLTDFDPSTGGWHTGTMRQRIGKELISIGINNANYGINSSVGEGESDNPYLAAQLTAHNSRGNYQNGIVTHGGSGGGGIVTLDATLGNEFSHELGHNFGIGHYPNGFNGSIHRQADNINSTWGWDEALNKFIPNMAAKKSNQSACLNGECQAPFDGRKFGSDSLAGGYPMSALNRFTLYTPYTAAHIQQNLESKMLFSMDSATGFEKWNPVAQQMEPYQHNVIDAEQVNASIGLLSENYLTDLFKDYDLVNIAMYNGNWSKYITVPAASDANKGRVISINHNAGYNSHLLINGESIVIYNGLKTSYRSNGTTWSETEKPDLTIAKVPTSFGIPVTTLVGYYDPQGVLPSYIYPALHGSYGFTYSDDSARLSANHCQLTVATKDGQVLAFKLANVRRNEHVMNKFHINIAQASHPENVTVICDGNILASKGISPVSATLSTGFNGYHKNKTYHQWGDYDRLGNIGDLYLYNNPYNGDKELFKLSGLGSDGRYWYFPTNKTNNRFWTYIADIE